MFTAIPVRVIKLKEDNLVFLATRTHTTVVIKHSSLSLQIPPSLRLSVMSLVADFACFPLGRFSVFSIPHTSTTNALTVLISTLGVTVDTSHPSSVHPKGRYETTKEHTEAGSWCRSCSRSGWRRCQPRGEQGQRSSQRLHQSWKRRCQCQYPWWWNPWWRS